jgi:hypothetical protein
MNLANCLISADIHVLRTIARRLRLECRLHSKHELMQAILSHFQNGLRVEESLKRLKKPYQQILVRLAMHPRDPVSLEDLAVIVNKALGDSENSSTLDAVYRDLMEEGWLFRTLSQPTPMFWIPDELRQKIQEWAIESLRESILNLPSQPLVYRDDQTAILRDLLTFLHFVEQHEVKLTQDGSIFKRQQLQLYQCLEVQELPISGTGWRFGYGRRFRDYPDRFALIYDYCFAKGWISEDEDGTLRRKSSPDDWLKLPDPEKIKDMFEFWKRVYRRSIAQLDLAVQLTLLVAKEQWVEVQSLQQVLAQYLEPYYYDTVEDILKKRILQMLRCLGILQIGQLAEDQLGIRLSALGLQVCFPEDVEAVGNGDRYQMESIVIQPNLEILVNHSQQTRIDYELLQFAELVCSDIFRMYRITPASIRRYIKTGKTVQDLLTFLQSLTPDPLPMGFEQRIQQWFEHYGSVRMFQSFLLECENEEVREEILEIPGVIACVEEVIGDRYILVTKGHETNILDRIEQAGKVVATIS